MTEDTVRSSEERSRPSSPQHIPDLFVNERKLQARLRSIYNNQPVQCYWRLGQWHIIDPPWHLAKVSPLSSITAEESARSDTARRMT